MSVAIIVEIITTIFMTVIILAASESHIFTSLLVKTKRAKKIIQWIYTSFVFFVIFIIEGVIGDFLQNALGDYVKILCFSYFVFMSFNSLFYSVSIKGLRSVKGIIYDSKIIKYSSNTYNDFSFSISDDNITLNNDTYVTDEENDYENLNKKDIIYNGLKNSNNLLKETKENLKNTANKESINKEKSNSQYKQEEYSEVINEETKQEDKYDFKLKILDDVKNTESNLICEKNEQKIDKNLQEDKTVPYQLFNPKLGVFHHEIRDNTVIVFEEVIHNESEESTYEILFVITQMIISSEIQNYNFSTFLIYSIIIDKNIFLIVCTLTCLIFLMVVIFSDGHVDYYCFQKVKIIVMGFSMILCASYTYNKTIR
jgi:hypothetical protein